MFIVSRCAKSEELQYVVSYTGTRNSKSYGVQTQHGSLKEETSPVLPGAMTWLNMLTMPHMTNTACFKGSCGARDLLQPRGESVGIYFPQPLQMAAFSCLLEWIKGHESKNSRMMQMLARTVIC